MFQKLKCKIIKEWENRVNDMKKIAIIPARSGSKGLKDKNIIDLCGKPLIFYTIDAAMKSGLFDRIIVSTDSEYYGEIAKKYGAEVMYRDESLSNDNATTYMVIENVLRHINEKIDYFVLLQPTSPLRNEKHIKEAVTLFEKNMNSYDFLVSVKEAEHSAILVKTIAEDCSLRYFDSDFANYKRQSYKEYTPNGAIFIGKIEPYLRQKHFFGEKGLAYFMDEFDSVDIDNEFDYEIAYMCMKKRRKSVK